MATFQSQLNILAAVNCGVHKRIVELENNQISVKYNEESTEFYMGNKTKQIKYLGYKAYDAILIVNKDKEYHFMDYTGKCEKIKENEEKIYIQFKFINAQTGTIKEGIIATVEDNGEIGVILNTELKLTTDDIPMLSSDNIIRYSREEKDAENKIIIKYGFIKLTSNFDIQDIVINQGGAISVNLKKEYKRYESTENYQNIKFIDLSTNQIQNDDPWTLPPN